MDPTNAAGMELVMSERLVRVETKLDVLLGEMRPQVADHDLRLRTLENAVAGLKVRVGLVSGGTGAGAGAVAALITYFTSR